MIKPIKAKKSFKVILNTGEGVYTGTATNANFATDFKQIIMDNSDFDKPYNMSFSFRNATDTNSSILSDSPIYINIALSNGCGNNKILTTNTLNGGGGGLLYSRLDSQNIYTKSCQSTITNTTAPNILTLSSVSTVGAGFLLVGHTVSIIGTSFGGLTAGNYGVASIAGNNITLFESPVLTTATGNMNLYYTYQIPVNRQGYLEAKYTDNAPTYIDNLRNINNINISMFSPTGLLTSISSWICILNFEEI